MKNKVKVLIVDDSSKGRALLKDILITMDLDVLEADSGLACLEIVEKENIDLILLDIMMPGMDGVEVLENLKKAGLLGVLPVIVITALDSIDNASKCLSLGAEDVIIRPYDVFLLKSRINGCLKNKATNAEYLDELEKKLLEKAKHLLSHEINNPLTVLQANLDLILMAMNKGESRVEVIKSYLEKLVDPSRRIESTVSKFRTLKPEQLNLLDAEKGLIGISDILEAPLEPEEIFFKWRKEFELGLKTIDGHHKKIVDYINELYEAIKSPHEKDAILLVIGKLQEYTIFHFKYEEEKFELSHYEDQKEHINFHDDFIDSIENFKDLFLNHYQEEMGFEIMEFLKEWLLKHILVEDKKYLDYFSEHDFD